MGDQILLKVDSWQFDAVAELRQNFVALPTGSADEGRIRTSRARHIMLDPGEGRYLIAEYRGWSADSGRMIVFVGKIVELKNAIAGGVES